MRTARTHKPQVGDTFTRTHPTMVYDVTITRTYRRDRAAWVSYELPRAVVTAAPVAVFLTQYARKEGQ